MSESEVATIFVLFHLGGYRCLKHFYLHYVCKHMKIVPNCMSAIINEFPTTRFLQALPSVVSRVYDGFTDSNYILFAMIRESYSTLLSHQAM